MAEAPLVESFETFSLLGVLLVFVIFTRLAVRARTRGVFQLQLCLFILLWALGEVPHIAGTLGLISTADYQDVGLVLHNLSMATFAIFTGARYFNLLRTFPKKPPMGRDQSFSSPTIGDSKDGPGLL